ncbi:hypothetical protein ISN45_At05g010080 [Arabidopsis thaliana x Arabidopsis arenosa]|uniref:Uncharacterized protein n=1 Tax=Arabidopsis thaliana x Arabidopsis arenosa TaxID=1240361 RepID=A0A8T2D4F4_9BRAS|nr:hypothetical protein ISN45_At05g010080 [Arabidopsis thaliana x Arabidopsis arenosa]
MSTQWLENGAISIRRADSYVDYSQHHTFKVPYYFPPQS